MLLPDNGIDNPQPGILATSLLTVLIVHVYTTFRSPVAYDPVGHTHGAPENMCVYWCTGTIAPSSQIRLTRNHTQQCVAAPLPWPRRPNPDLVPSSPHPLLGVLYASLGNLHYLQTLDLSVNNLNGKG